jgi:hypothetical protein
MVDITVVNKIKSKYNCRKIYSLASLIAIQVEENGQEHRKEEAKKNASRNSGSPETSAASGLKQGSFCGVFEIVESW